MADKLLPMPNAAPKRLICELLIVGIVAAWFFAAPEAEAAPVFGKAMALRQPGGSLVQTRAWGDEFYQVVESLDGYTLVRDPDSGEVCYARLSADATELISTGISASHPPPKRAEVTPHLRVLPESSAAKARAARAAWETVSSAKSGYPHVFSSLPSVGAVNGLCLLVDFSDEPQTVSAAEVRDFCNQTGYSGYDNQGSVRDYFGDVSSGLLTYTNYVPDVYYRASRPKSYYDDPADFAHAKTLELVVEALHWLNNQGFSFSAYDANHDGFVDAVNVLYAGTATSGWGAGLWPHNRSGSPFAILDGVYVATYQITDMGNDLGIGTFCHENGHMLFGWPDLYDYDADSRGVGAYCLMGGGAFAKRPVKPCAYLREQAGWVTPVLLNAPGSAFSASADEGTIFKYANSSNNREYYLIENRHQTGRDERLPDSGLAIWHIDKDGSNDYQQMTPSRHYKVTLVQADGRWDLERNQNAGDASDLWKAPQYAECGPWTSPNTRWWDGSSSDLNIANISEPGPVMTFDQQHYWLVSPNDPFVSSGLKGGPFTPSERTYTVTNYAQDSVSWTVYSPAEWLSVTPGQGVLASGESAEITVALSSAAASLAPGTYQGVVLFNNLLTGVTVQHVASLTINKSVIVAFPFDTDPQWTREGLWMFGSPQGLSGDPLVAHTGSTIFGYNLNGAYPNGMESTEYLTTTAMDCSGHRQVSFSFYRWLSAEMGELDYADIEASNDGITWTVIWSNDGIVVQDSAWTPVTYNISAVADGQATVYLRWGMGPTDSIETRAGWNIDDVVLLGIQDATPAPPILRLATPPSSSVRGGARVTLWGTNFLAPVNVFFGDVPALQVDVKGPTLIEVVAPASPAGTADIRVLAAGGEARLENAFLYVDVPPTIDSLSPDAIFAHASESIVIKGSALTGCTAVLFGETVVAAFTLVSDTEIQVTAPALPEGSVDVTVICSGDVTSNAVPLTYLPPPQGSLRVHISPEAALSAGAQWRVDGGAWQNSDARVDGLPPGSHTVSFAPVPGWTEPQDMPAAISDGAETLLSVAYVERTGSVIVTIGPEGAVAAGAQWRLDGGPWQPSGAQLDDLTLGSHRIDFASVPGWIPPPETLVDIVDGPATATHATYVRQTGLLRVTLGPEAAVAGGAQWRVGDGSWMPSGEAVELPLGEHAIFFKEVIGLGRFVTPATATIALSESGATVAVNQQYASLTLIEAADINGDGVWDALDVQLVINAALKMETGFNCDVDGNGSIDALDVQLVINAALRLL